MKFTNRKRPKAAVWLILCVMLTGCGKKSLEMAYDPDYPVSSFRMVVNDRYAVSDSFAANLCVASGNVLPDGGRDIEDIGAAGLFDLSRAEVLYAENIHSKMYPASLTKLMTVLVALKYGSLNDMLTASENVKMKDPLAQTFGLKQGDRMTLDQALHILLIYSANDVAVMVAEHIGGSVEEFVRMMNEEAAAIGATNTHFMNPHGLSDNNHYTTAYDLYLIFTEVMQYEEFRQIIAMNRYTTVYTDALGKSHEETVKTTNLYLLNQYQAPSKITVIGGKTGTTSAAGNCLIILAKDDSGNQYISIILKAMDRDSLYKKMYLLLNKINEKNKRNE